MMAQLSLNGSIIISNPLSINNCSPTIEKLFPKIGAENDINCNVTGPYSSYKKKVKLAANIF